MVIIVKQDKEPVWYLELRNIKDFRIDIGVFYRRKVRSNTDIGENRNTLQVTGLRIHIIGPKVINIPILDLCDVTILFVRHNLFEKGMAVYLAIANNMWKAKRNRILKHKRIWRDGNLINHSRFYIDVRNSEIDVLLHQPLMAVGTMSNFYAGRVNFSLIENIPFL